MKKATFIILSLWTINTQAQYTVRRGILSTSPASVTSVQGDLVVRGDVVHRGVMMLYDNLTTDGVFEASSGSLWLVGLDQRIQTDASFGHLTVRGGGAKQIKGNLEVLNKLQLSSGILQTQEADRLIVAATATITEGSPASHIDGFLYHTGTGEKFYPIGKDGTYAPATLIDITGDDPTVGMAYFPSAKLSGTEFHWQQSVIDGTYDGSAAELTFISENSDYRKYSDELVVLAGSDGSSGYVSLGQSSLNIRDDRFTIVSAQSTALPMLTVGFDIPEDTKHLYIPNAFSPTAPNAEDRCIKVYGQKISSRNFYFAIQDVWGTVVYETHSREEAAAQGWSGAANTSGVAVTYRYRLEGAFIGGKRFQQTGTIVQY